MDKRRGSLETGPAPLLAENHSDNRLSDYRTDYGYKDFRKSPAKCFTHFAGFFLALAHKLPPSTKISTGATRLMFTIYNKFYVLSIVLHKKIKKK